MSRIVEINASPESRYGTFDVLLDSGERLESVRSVEWINHVGEAQIVRLEIVLKQQPTVVIKPK